MTKRIYLKVIALFLFCGLLLSGFWYFKVKTYDYQVSFTVKASKASVFFRIADLEEWEMNSKEQISLENSKAYDYINFRIENEDGNISLGWKFQKIDDSLTQVSVGILDDSKSMSNRWQVLTRQKGFEDQFITRVRSLKNDLESYTNTFKVEIVGESKTPSLNYVYIPLEGKVQEKAGKMMSAVNTLTAYLKQHKIEPVGNPFVEVTEWQTTRNHIKFNFCFPVEKAVDLPGHKLVKVGEMSSSKALKAVYYGNYATSNEAWFALAEHLKKRNQESVYQPIELYLDNPHNGGNDREWRAEVYLPLK